MTTKITSKLIKVFLQLFRQLRWLNEFRRYNKFSLIHGNSRKQIWAYKKGFYLETINLCCITDLNVHEYLSDKEYRELHPINKTYSTIIDNKLYLPFLLKDYPELAPEYFFFIDKGRIVNLQQENKLDDGILELCTRKRKLVFKHCFSSFGHGFYLLEWQDGVYSLNNEQKDQNELNSFINSLDNYIVTEYVCQNKYSNEINQSSVNTIRIQCVWDFNKKEFFIPRAFHRFGINGKLVDNLGSEGGGILAHIDINRGKIKDTGLRKVPGKPEERIQILNHPDSHKPIAGIIIPFWDNIIDKTLSVMQGLSFLKYTGMDIVVTNDGFKILEFNSLPTLSVLQIEGGFFKDERTNCFFHNIMNNA